MNKCMRENNNARPFGHGSVFSARQTNRIYIFHYNFRLFTAIIAGVFAEHMYGVSSF